MSAARLLTAALLAILAAACSGNDYDATPPPEAVANVPGAQWVDPVKCPFDASFPGKSGMGFGGEEGSPCGESHHAPSPKIDLGHLLAPNPANTHF